MMKEKESVNLLESTLGIPKIIARLLVRRGISDPNEAQAFLFPTLKDLSDPFLLPDIDKGIMTLLMAIKNSEKICIYGDYDADGITSSALIQNFLNKLHVHPLTYIPNRREGYGLNIEAIKRLKKDNVGLIICVDCGSANIEEVKFAYDLGIKTVIIDHHEIYGPLPNAEAIINPKRKDSHFPTRDLAACGVTFFFLWALRRVMHKEGLLDGNINLKNELDLVTVGTIGDMVPLVGDNRVMTKIGMDIMKKRPKQWLKAFYKEHLIPKSELNEFALNFIIIPRINAAGRVSLPEESLDFLLTEKEYESIKLINTLQQANNLRQKLCERILKECNEEIERKGLYEKNAIVLFNKDWHIGVIGIVAQKLTEQYKKPSLIITEIDGICKGSGRAPEHIDLYEIMCSLSHLLKGFGGHKFACGFSLRKEDIEEFRSAFEGATGEKKYKEDEVYFDTWADFDEFDADFASILEAMSPFGVGNPRPSFIVAPIDVLLFNDNRIKIKDRRSRQWYGYINNPEILSKRDGLKLVVQPFIREEMGSRFISFNVKGVL